VRAYHKATGETWEGDTSRLASPDTGLAQNAEVPRGGGAGRFWPAFFSSLGAFYQCYSGLRGRRRKGEIMKFFLKPLAALLPLVFVVPAYAVEQLAALDTIVVSATRQPQRLSETISDMTVIEKEQIERASASTLGELLGHQAGIEFNRSGGHGAPESIYIRGAEAKHALILLDGVRFGSASLGTTALEMVPVSQIERIEIVRGPASSIYGSDAIGGVINIITRRDFEGVEIGLGYGNRKTFDTNLSAAGKFGQLTAATRLGWSGAQGINSITNPGNDFYNPDKDGTRNHNASLDLRYAFSPDTEIGLTYLESVSHSRLDNALYDPNTFTYSLAGLDYQTRRTITKASVTASTKINSTWRTSLTMAQGFDESVANLPITAGSGPQKFSTTQDQLAWQNDIKLPLGEALVLWEHLNQKIDGTQTYVTQSRSIDSLSLGWTARFDHHSIQLNAREDQNSQFGERLTYSAGYGYRISPELIASASHGTGFKAPAFDDLYYPNDGFGQGNKDLKPESSINTEYALRYDNGLHAFKVARFENKVTNLIQWAPTANPNFWTPSNVGKVQIDGWELQGSTKWSDWRFSASANFQNPRYLTDGPDGSTKVGDMLRRRAKSYGTFQVARQFGAFSVSVDLTTTGSRNEYYFDWGSNQQAVLKMGGYSLVNLHADWQLNQKSKLFLQVYNLFDRQYEVAKSSTTNFGTPGMSIFAGVRYAL
jgi:vitamin B12 transporter